jgi:Rrf2 family protein
MLVPSKRIFYALEAVLFIAYNSKSGAIASRDIAERQQLPARYLEPILQKLVRAGVLKSVRGPQGGYVLGRERRRITLKDICDVLSEDELLPNSSLPLGEEVLRPVMTEAQGAWLAQLAEINIASLCERAAEQGIAPAFEQPQDFTI